MTSKEKIAPVTGFVRSFISGWPIVNAKISFLENSDIFLTDNEGRFGPIYFPVGSSITLVVEKEGFRTTQSATFTVPEDGLTGDYKNISFQVPSEWAYLVFSLAIGIKENPNACQIATTVTAYNKTLDDLPQGEADAEGVILPPIKNKPFYFSFFNWGPLKHKTNPFNRTLSKTSIDGGIIYPNVEPSDIPYTLTAKKNGVTFSEVKVLARPGVFINVSPPHGPMAQEEELAISPEAQTVRQKY